MEQQATASQSISNLFKTTHRTTRDRFDKMSRDSVFEMELNEDDNNINRKVVQNIIMKSRPKYETKLRRNFTLLTPKRSRGIINPTLISLAIITFIAYNQLLNSLTTAAITDSNQNRAFGTSPTNNHQIRNAFGSQLFGLAEAVPAPEPAAANSKSSTSRSRGPPLNGSIFGKRSLDNAASGRLRQRQTESTLRKPDESKVYVPKQTSLKEISSSSSSVGSINQSEAPKGAAYKSSTPAANEAANYKDIITEIIEDFLALNNESNPEKASVAFCRMIVYECSQMLSSRSRAQAGRLRRRIAQLR